MPGPEPVEEYQEVVPSAGCENVEPIPDLLNYRPGKQWSFSLTRVQLTPRDEQWDYGNHRAAINTQATFQILPEMNVEGEQSLSGAASAGLEWEILPVTTESHECTGAESGPLSAPVDFIAGTMTWDSFSLPPSLNLTSIIRAEGVPRIVNYGIIYFLNYGPDAEWHEEEIGLAYVRTYGFGAVPMAPFSGTWDYPSGSRTPEDPWWFLLTLSYPSYSSTENVSLAPF